MLRVCKIQKIWVGSGYRLGLVVVDWVLLT